MSDAWSVVEVVRTGFLGLSALAIFQQLILASHYWWRIIPLRKALASDRAGQPVNVLAPPIVWTFAYHLMVLAYLIWTSAGTYFALSRSIPASPTVWAGPPLALGMSVVINRFVAYYSDTLNQAAWQKLRREDVPGSSST